MIKKWKKTLKEKKDYIQLDSKPSTFHKDIVVYLAG